MLPANVLTDKVSVVRRTSVGRDALNNPVYGEPTDGVGWNTIYDCVPCRLAFSSKIVRFAQEGERINPTGVMYYQTDFDIRAEDRVLTDTGIEYNVISVVPAKTFGTMVDHYEAVLQLP